MTPPTDTTQDRPAPAAPYQDHGMRARRNDPFPVRVSRGAGRLPARGQGLGYEGTRLRVRMDHAPAPGKAVKLWMRVPIGLAHGMQAFGLRTTARVAESRRLEKHKKDFEVTLELGRPLQDLVDERVRAHKRKVNLAILGLVALTVWFKWIGLTYFWYQPVLAAYSLLISTYFLSRFILAWLYSPPPLKDYTPTLSICISVRNDEKAIIECVDSCFEADYPAGKREVIVVNDGSTDGTLAALQELQKKYDKLSVISIPPSGKRHGMTAAIKKAKGEIVVVVDSDTFLDSMALRHIVSGFEDPRQGAVSGHTNCANVETNSLTGMQAIRYFVSFKLLKTSESLFGCVTCCPGCLSAYRRSYLLAIIDDWLNQKFMGAPATFGDDRSLTRYILKDYDVIYNENAVCGTISPDNWKQYLNQQVRWKKSWARETLLAASFMWRKHPLAVISFYISSAVSLMSPAVAYVSIYTAVTDPYAPYAYYFVGFGLYAVCQSIFYLRQRGGTRWLLGIWMVISHLFLLGPQTYYAILTLRKNHWGTR
jgi:hyaluronan synthase